MCGRAPYLQLKTTIYSSQVRLEKSRLITIRPRQINPTGDGRIPGGTVGWTHMPESGHRRNISNDSSKVGRGRHTDGDDSSKVGRGHHTGGDVSSKIYRQPSNLQGCSGRSTDKGVLQQSPARSADDATPTVTTSARSAEDATPAVMSPARSTVNPAIFRGVVVGPPTKVSQNFESTTTSSPTERSSSDVICPRVACF